jgi:hypothetical protein
LILFHAEPYIRLRALSVRVPSVDTTTPSFHEKLNPYDLDEGHPFRANGFVNPMRLFTNHGLFNKPQATQAQPQPASIEGLLRIHDKKNMPC